MPQRRNVLLVNKRFQLKYSFFVVSWIFVLSLVYPYITYNLFEFFISFAKVHSPATSVADLMMIQKEFLSLMIMFHLVFLGVIFLISLFVSHKIAGPLYKLRKRMDEVREGNLDDHLKFRKADHFQELAEDFNDLTASLKSRMSQKEESIQKAIEVLESGAGEGGLSRDRLDEALSELRKVRDPA